MQMNGHDGGPIKASWLNKDDLWIWPGGQSELTSSPIGCSSRPLRVSSSLSSNEFFCPLSESTLLWMELSLGGVPFPTRRASLVAQTVKNLPAVLETRVWSLGKDDPLEKDVATHSCILAWEIPWTEESGGLQSMGSQRVGHDWTTNTPTHPPPPSPTPAKFNGEVLGSAVTAFGEGFFPFLFFSFFFFFFEKVIKVKWGQLRGANSLALVFFEEEEEETQPLPSPPERTQQKWPSAARKRACSRNPPRRPLALGLADSRTVRKPISVV